MPIGLGFGSTLLPRPAPRPLGDPLRPSSQRPTWGRCAAAADLAGRKESPMEEVRLLFEEAADLAKRNRFRLLEVLALGELQRW